MIIYLIAILTFQLVSCSDCPDICGDFPPPHKQVTRDTKKTSHSRIVNGWTAEDRGFMVLIRAHKDSDDYETCGGSMLNNRYVLTAGHCVCLQSGYSYVQCSREGKLLYDPQKVIKVYVDVNSRDIKKLDSHVRKGHIHEYSVEKVITHPDWDGSGSTYPDLAVLKLAKKVEFISGKGLDIGFTGTVLPICLAKENQFKVYNETVYVAGWGRIRNDECFTDDHGPSRHAKCRFPFIFKGEKYYGCTTKPSPSRGNKRCQQFRKEKGEKAMPGQGDSIMILYNKKKRSTVCYHEYAGNHGWCGVCLKDAARFQYGYCPQGHSPPDDDEVITRARRSKDWGFCSGNCKSVSEASVLQETGLQVLPPDECAIFDTPTLGYRKDIEYCAANKIPYPRIKVYTRKKLRKPRNGISYIFEYYKDKKNTLGASREHAELNYYLGNTDSCQGDSGGPLYKFHDKKAYLIGVVSRGDDCAGFNQPGIYTDVSKFRNWILETISDGSCEVN